MRPAPPPEDWLSLDEPESVPLAEEPAPQPEEPPAATEPPSTWPPFLSPADDDWLSEM